MRLIDADALIDVFEQKIRTGELESYDDMFDIIEKFPTADVQRVQHGQLTWRKESKNVQK